MATMIEPENESFPLAPWARPSAPLCPSVNTFVRSTSTYAGFVLRPHRAPGGAESLARAFPVERGRGIPPTRVLSARRSVLGLWGLVVSRSRGVADSSST